MNRDGQPVLSVEVTVSQRRSWVDLSSTPELLFVFWGEGLCRGALHSWNSLKKLPDMPSATHHVNGKEGLEGSQPGGPCASHVGEPY